MIPDFLHIPIGEEADLLRPLSASQSASDRTNRPLKAVTRSALKKSSKSAFRTARRPLNFGVGSVRTPDGETRGRTITKSRSEMQLKGLVKNRRPNDIFRLIFFVSKTDFNHQKIKNQKFDQDLKNLVQDRPVVQKRNLLFHQKND